MKTFMSKYFQYQYEIIFTLDFWRTGKGRLYYNVGISLKKHLSNSQWPFEERVHCFGQLLSSGSSQAMLPRAMPFGVVTLGPCCSFHFHCFLSRHFHRQIDTMVIGYNAQSTTKVIPQEFLLLFCSQHMVSKGHSYIVFHWESRECDLRYTHTLICSYKIIEELAQSLNIIKSV